MAVIQKNQRTCIFCAERGVNSKEHFFPDWLPDHIKVWDTTQHAIIRMTEDVNRSTKKRTAKETYGALATRKIRCVCTVCNGGWMSRAEQKVRPHIESMLTGKPTPLNDQAARDVAHWIAMKVVVSEHGDRETLVTPQEIRTSIMQGTVPDCFNIYLGSHLAQDLGYCRTSHTLGKSGGAIKPNDDGTFTKNVQQVTFCIGRFFAHVNQCLIPGIDLENFAGNYGFYQISKIWPRRNLIIWPPTQPLTADQLNGLASSFQIATGGCALDAIK
jgi:hypothetical protein